MSALLPIGARLVIEIHDLAYQQAPDFCAPYVAWLTVYLSPALDESC